MLLQRSGYSVGARVVGFVCAHRALYPPVGTPAAAASLAYVRRWKSTKKGRTSVLATTTTTTTTTTPPSRQSHHNNPSAIPFDLKSLLPPKSVPTPHLKQEVQQWLSRHRATSDAHQVTEPFLTFAQLQPYLPPWVVDHLQTLGLAKPTPAQALAWSAYFTLQKDVHVVAPTSAGKTLAYLIPSLAHLIQVKRTLAKTVNDVKGPFVVILVPFRKDAEAIAELYRSFSEACPEPGVGAWNVQCVTGGGGERKNVPSFSDRMEFERGMDVCIATTSRLSTVVHEMLAFRSTSILTKVGFLAFDDIHNMMFDNSEPEIRMILDALPTRRRTMLVTPAAEQEIQDMADQYLPEGIKVSVSNATTGSYDILYENLTQRFVEVSSQEDHYKKLCKLISELHNAKDETKKILLLCQTKAQGEAFLAKLPTAADGEPEPLPRIAFVHEDTPWAELQQHCLHFRQGQARILLATDQEATHLATPDVTEILHVTVPSCSNDYVYRLGLLFTSRRSQARALKLRNSRRTLTTKYTTTAKDGLIREFPKVTMVNNSVNDLWSSHETHAVERPFRGTSYLFLQCDRHHRVIKGLTQLFEPIDSQAGSFPVPTVLVTFELYRLYMKALRQKPVDMPVDTFHYNKPKPQSHPLNPFALEEEEDAKGNPWEEEERAPAWHSFPSVYAPKLELHRRGSSQEFWLQKCKKGHLWGRPLATSKVWTDDRRIRKYLIKHPRPVYLRKSSFDNLVAEKDIVGPE